jgi:hypothetical protein
MGYCLMCGQPFVAQGEPRFGTASKASKLIG